ncbi:MAG: T9SS type A sorting domain-containing protein [Chlorobi bacterium]|nr:T9SS type A sorting domain-containing protein [Chlorobiota bacterium]
MNSKLSNIFSEDLAQRKSSAYLVFLSLVVLFFLAFNNLHAAGLDSDSDSSTTNMLLMPETNFSSHIFSSFFTYPLLNYDNKKSDSDGAKDSGILTSAVKIDTSSQENKIISIIEQSDGTQKLTLQLEDNDQSVDIKVYNMIGKKVADVHSGSQLPNNEYTIESGRLPNGVYLCVVVGRNIRLVGKFIVSRG